MARRLVLRVLESRVNGKENGSYHVIRLYTIYIGLMEKKMQTNYYIILGVYLGLTEKKMESTIQYIGAM